MTETLEWLPATDHPRYGEPLAESANCVVVAALAAAEVLDHLGVVR